jgi:hypothetical protein
MLADEPITDGSIEQQIGRSDPAQEPPESDVAKPVCLALKLGDFGGGNRSLYIEQKGADVGSIAHLGAIPKIRGATVAAKWHPSENRLHSDRA